MPDAVFHAEVSMIGADALSFIKDKMLILFNEKIAETNPDIANVCILIKNQELLSPVCPGNLLILGGDKYRVTAVGSVANKNLESLGHCVIQFDGKEIAELPGNIHVEDLGMPEVKESMKILCMPNN